MNTTTITNLLRVLEAREADGSATVTGEEKTTTISKLIEKLAAVTMTDQTEIINGHNYYTRAIDMMFDNGDKIITGTDRQMFIASHIALLSAEWPQKETQMGAILDALQKRETPMSASSANTYTGEDRETLKKKLLILIETI